MSMKRTSYVIVVVVVRVAETLKSHYVLDWGSGNQTPPTAFRHNFALGVVNHALGTSLALKTRQHTTVSRRATRLYYRSIKWDLVNSVVAMSEVLQYPMVCDPFFQPLQRTSLNNSAWCGVEWCGVVWCTGSRGQVESKRDGSEEKGAKTFF